MNCLKYIIYTYGCAQNVNDSERIAYIAERMGYKKTQLVDEADLVIINTCAVRENAENRIFGKLGEIKGNKKEDAVVCFCGCMAETHPVREKIHKSFAFVDIIMGTDHINSLGTLVKDVLDNRQKQELIGFAPGSDGKVLGVLREQSPTALVTIMNGCDNFCSYCIVPYTRGRQRSRPLEDILHEIGQLVADGYKEVILLGQNVNSYGIDLQTGLHFPELLQQVSAIPGLARIRFLTSHPKDLTQEVIDVIAAHDNICKHIHLPVQSGSNEILSLMNRGYTREKYLEIIHKIRDKMPDVCITTDIIVGFPGEKQRHVDDTIALMEQAKFDSAFVFKYSRRQGTKAALMELGGTDCSESFERVRLVGERLAYASNCALVGKELICLVEGVSKNDESMLTARTEHNKIVHVSANSSLIGSLVPIVITHAKTWNMIGIKS